jgi:hypothetical protein
LPGFYLTTNALNLIDGLDGLCSGMGLCGTLTLFVGALIQGNVALARATSRLLVRYSVFFASISTRRRYSRGFRRSADRLPAWLFRFDVDRKGNNTGGTCSPDPGTCDPSDGCFAFDHTALSQQSTYIFCGIAVTFTIACWTVSSASGEQCSCFISSLL